MPRLTYTADGDTHVVEVTDSCSIGKADTNAVCLPNEPAASRRHCQIMKLSNSYELSDLDSTNGTLVNGKKVKRHSLRDGDRIQIGETVLSWDDDSGGEIELEDGIELEIPGDAPARGPAPRGGGGSQSGKSKGGEDCYLVYAGGDKDGQKILLDKDRVTFGRKSSNTVPVEDSAISGYHCEVSREGGAYILRDLGSTNGTLLDGDPVTEIALQHGGRIRIGGVRLVFIDPAVSEFEGAMAAVDDLGSEWGLLRAEMDMERVTKARRSQVIGVVALLVVVGGAAWLVLGTDILKKKTEAVATLEGNLLDDWSFEARSGGWSALTDTPARAAYASGKASQGTNYYEVTRDGPAGDVAVAESSHKLTVRPGQRYEFGAQVEVSGGGFGVVRVRWISAGAGEDLARYGATSSSAASAWTELRGTAVPPSGTTEARLQLVNAGPGTASFDDVFFRQAPAGVSGGAEATVGDLTLRASPDGTITVTRGNEPLLIDAAVVGGALGPNAANAARRAPRVGANEITSVSVAGGGVEVQGKTLDPESGELAAYSFGFTPREGGGLVLTAQLPQDAAVLAQLPSQFVAQGIGTFRTDGSSLRLSESRVVRDVGEAFVGETHPFQLKMPEDQSVVLALYSRERGWEIGFGGADTLSLPIVTDAQTLIRERQDRIRQLGEASARKQYGEAILLAGQVIAKLPDGHPERNNAQELQTRLVREGEGTLAQLADNIEAAIKFEDAGDLRDTARAARDWAALYAGHRIETESLALAKAADEALAARRAKRVSADAAPVLARANDLLEQDDIQLARAFYIEAVERFPGTPEAQQAQAKLDELKGR